MTTYQGASPEQVETVVTGPIESSMATVSNIKHISSTSSENYSLVILEFNTDANMDSVTIEMQGKSGLVESYWPDGSRNADHYEIESGYDAGNDGGCFRRWNDHRGSQQNL